ncbi:MAG: beta-mannosidase, partial [Frankiaceae bacterium]|nr:beta-mannosidase [Frankiaceae bacterium]
RTSVATLPGRHILQLAGLATVADVLVAGVPVLHSESMFIAHRVPVDLPGGDVEIAIRCAALTPLLSQKRPRPRWRSGLVAHQGLRWWRTTLLGRMPGWAAAAQPVGPFRPVSLRAADPLEVVTRSITTSVVDGTGIVVVSVTLAGAPDLADAVIAVGPVTAPAEQSSVDGATTVSGTVSIPGVELWWPHTHGRQPLYPLALRAGSITVDLGVVGFRTVEADTRLGAFTLGVNGVPVFARGACWVPPDPVSLNAADAEVRAALEQCVAAGFNIVRVTGTMVYEPPEFWRLCSELGLLVWQDCMLATMDPPADDAFEAAVIAELGSVFSSLQGCPALAVISGGSETEQQPAMLGLPAERRALPLLEQTIPALARQLLPGVPYVTSSPSGGVPPTRIDTGVSHYFGVGAYLRPMSDARTAAVRFAAESLAVATPPERETVARFFDLSAAGHHPRWKAAVPRDNGASWDFEDVLDHYVREFFGVEPARLRRSDPDRALDLGRAAAATLVHDTFAEWRRPASTCAGAIVLSLRDLVPGAGWGLVDSTGLPKAPLYAAAPVLAPVAVFVTDEGLDGVAIHVANDAPGVLQGTLTAQLFGVSGNPLESVSAAITVAGHDAHTWSLLELLGEFRDLNHAYKFGPPAYDAVHVTVTDPLGDVACAATHLLLGPARPLVADVGLAAAARPDGADYRLAISTEALAQWVSIDCPGYRPDRSWFHLPPGGTADVRLVPTDAATGAPAGTVRALNSRATAAFSAAAGAESVSPE